MYPTKNTFALGGGFQISQWYGRSEEERVCQKIRLKLTRRIAFGIDIACPFALGYEDANRKVGGVVYRSNSNEPDAREVGRFWNIHYAGIMVMHAGKALRVFFFWYTLRTRQHLSSRAATDEIWIKVFGAALGAASRSPLGLNSLATFLQLRGLIKYV